ncbi:MAG: hypothetical protein JSV86_05610 [Gemmatimonadota bacterium]|nr:MAG: hypothetical protein JSV86_05610 [Gemmatimonadota bacterium]
MSDVDQLVLGVLGAQVGTAARFLYAAEDRLTEVSEEYRGLLEMALEDGAEQLAKAAAGDKEAVDELAVIRARVMLWSWAGAERARQEFVTLLKQWLYEATKELADIAMAVFELGLRALVDAGLEELRG